MWLERTVFKKVLSSSVFASCFLQKVTRCVNTLKMLDHVLEKKARARTPSMFGVCLKQLPHLFDCLYRLLAGYSHGLVLNSVRVESRVSNFLQISKQPNKIKKKGRKILLQNFAKQ